LVWEDTRGCYLHRSEWRVFMRLGYSHQHQQNSVIVEPEDRGKVNEVIAFAMKNGAHSRGKLLIDVRVDEHHYGPDFYEEDDLR